MGSQQIVKATLLSRPRHPTTIETTASLRETRAQSPRRATASLFTSKKLEPKKKKAARNRRCYADMTRSLQWCDVPTPNANANLIPTPWLVPSAYQRTERFCSPSASTVRAESGARVLWLVHSRGCPVTEVRRCHHEC